MEKASQALTERIIPALHMSRFTSFFNIMSKEAYQATTDLLPPLQMDAIIFL